MADAAIRARARGISVGLLAASPLDLGAASRQVSAWGGQMAHFDVMDGVFVPQITAGPAFLAAAGSLLRDVHLMVADPARHVAAFADAGADIVTVHAEAPGAVLALSRVREASARLHRPILAGLAVMPGTALDDLAPLLALAPDLILVLTLDPRDGRTADVAQGARRLADLRHRTAPGTILAIDGGITLATVDMAAQVGPEIIVSGSAVLAAPDPALAFSRLSDAWAAGQKAAQQAENSHA